MIEAALATLGKEDTCEIAFFGGSFTGIDYGLMCSLLEIAHSYLIDGRVNSIRCSTRPDYINKRILDDLKKYGVGTIELGLQSTSDAVLLATKRGHTREDEIRACRMIVDYGFELVGQMMIGLPESTRETEAETARLIAELGASAARIYPTVVFRDTELCDMAKVGVYRPLPLDEAVSRTADALEILRAEGVKVIRIGLCASESLSDPSSYFAGPNHAAIGELVVGELYFREVDKRIFAEGYSDGEITVLCPKGNLSKVIGQRKKNKLRLAERYPSLTFKFREDEGVEDGRVAIQYKERKTRCI